MNGIGFIQQISSYRRIGEHTRIKPLPSGTRYENLRCWKNEGSKAKKQNVRYKRYLNELIQSNSIFDLPPDHAEVLDIQAGSHESVNDFE